MPLDSPSIACGDTLEFGHNNDLERSDLIVQKWQQLEYLYGRMMDPSSIGEQVERTRLPRGTLRRIAITPAYPEAVADENLAESGLDAIELKSREGRLMNRIPYAGSVHDEEEIEAVALVLRGGATALRLGKHTREMERLVADGFREVRGSWSTPAPRRSTWPSSSSASSRGTRC